MDSVCYVWTSILFKIITFSNNRPVVKFVVIKGFFFWSSQDEKSNKYFLELITLYPDHYRVPLAHKKIGDIFLKNSEIDKAKDKYNYVIREYPNNTASSLALQLLKNME